MPVKVKKIGDKFRVVKSATGKLSKTKSGSPSDGGGHRSRAKAVNQVQAMNLAERRRTRRRK